MRDRCGSEWSNSIKVHIQTAKTIQKLDNNRSKYSAKIRRRQICRGTWHGRWCRRLGTPASVRHTCRGDRKDAASEETQQRCLDLTPHVDRCHRRSPLDTSRSKWVNQRQKRWQNYCLSKQVSSHLYHGAEITNKNAASEQLSEQFWHLIYYSKLCQKGSSL